MIFKLYVFLYFSDLIEDIDSPEEDSCNSSRFTNKSDKNMSDFEGEDVLSDDELAHINAHSHFVGIHPMQHQLANLASIYHKQLPQGNCNELDLELLTYIVPASNAQGIN